MKNTNLKNINYPIIHEKIFHNESSHQRFQRSSKLIRCKESNMTNSNQWCYKMFQVAWIKALMKRLKMRGGKDNPTLYIGKQTVHIFHLQIIKNTSFHILHGISSNSSLHLDFYKLSMSKRH